MRRLHPRGQGMLELIITFAVVGIGLGAALSLLLSSGIENKRTELDAIGENLAREGLEVIRSIRDSNWLAGRAFDDGLYVPGDIDGTLEFDPAAGGWALNFTPTTWSAGAPAFPATPATIHEQGGLYVQRVTGVLAPASPFRRVFRLQSICDVLGTMVVDATHDCGGSPQAKVGVAAAVYVEWADRGKTFSTAVEEHLYDWKL